MKLVSGSVAEPHWQTKHTHTDIYIYMLLLLLYVYMWGGGGHFKHSTDPATFTSTI
jgi:hypothetical protein